MVTSAPFTTIEKNGTAPIRISYIGYNPNPNHSTCAWIRATPTVSRLDVSYTAPNPWMPK